MSLANNLGTVRLVNPGRLAHPDSVSRAMAVRNAIFELNGNVIFELNGREQFTTPDCRGMQTGLVFSYSL